MNILTVVLFGTVFSIFAWYVKLPLWIYAPRDPWSPWLQTDLSMYRRLPFKVWHWYERNLIWRRNRSARSYYCKELDMPLSEVPLEEFSPMAMLENGMNAWLNEATERALAQK
jgi:hypothetical protein